MVTRPEAALHFNLKCHLAAELAAGIGSGRALRVTERCLVGQSGLSWKRRFDTPAPDGYSQREWLANPCEEQHERTWLETWDRVELERRIGDERAARIPDIVLYRGESVVGAIEVFHSHAVDDDKAAALHALGVPWVEVRADEALLTDGSAWKLDAPLPAHRIGPASRWRCAVHEADHQAALEAEAREREAARHTQRVCAVKFVDVFFPSGRDFRNVYRVIEMSTDGVPHTLTLERSGKTLLTLPYDSSRRAVLWRRLKARCEADVSAVEQRCGAVTDSPMEWATGALAERIAERVAAGIRSRRPLERTYPIRYHFHAEQSQWLLLDDLRDVSWDHAAEDLVIVPSQTVTALSSSTRSSKAPTTSSEGIAASSRWLTPLTRPDLGASVADAETLPAASVYVLSPTESTANRVVVVPREHAGAAELRQVDDALRASGVERLWISHRNAWPTELRNVPWLPFVAAPDGGHALPVSGTAMPVAAAVTAFANGSPALDPARIVARRIAAKRHG